MRNMIMKRRTDVVDLVQQVMLIIIIRRWNEEVLEVLEIEELNDHGVIIEDAQLLQHHQDLH